MKSAPVPMLGRADAVLACPCGTAWQPHARCGCGRKIAVTAEIPVLLADADSRARQVASCDPGLFRRRSLQETFQRLPHPDTTWHWSRFLSHSPDGPVAILDSEQGGTTLALCPPDQHDPLIGFTALQSALWGRARLRAYGKTAQCFVHGSNQLPFLPHSLGLLVVRYPQRLTRDPSQLWSEAAKALVPNGYLYVEGVSAGVLPWLSLASQRADLLEGTRHLRRLGFNVVRRWAKAPTLEGTEFMVDLDDPSACRYTAQQLAPLYLGYWPRFFPRTCLSRRGMGIGLLAQRGTQT